MGVGLLAIVAVAGGLAVYNARSPVRAFLVVALVAVAGLVFALQAEVRVTPATVVVPYAPHFEYVTPAHAVPRAPAAPAVEAYSSAPVTRPVARRVKRNDCDDAVTFEINGRACETRDAAWIDAYARAVRQLEHEFGLRHDVSPEEIKEKCDGKELSVPLGEPLGDAKKVVLTMTLEPEYIQKLAKREREYRMGERMGWTARGLAVFVAGLFAVAGFVRLDEWSKGYYTGWLKAGALAAVAAAVGGAILLR